MSNGTATAKKILTRKDDLRLYRPRKFNATTKQRFLRDRRRRLVQHIGGNPNDVQAVIIDRIVAIEWSVNRLQARLDEEGELSPHSARALLAFHNHLRLLTRELGLKPVSSAAGPSLVDVLRRYGSATSSPQTPEAVDPPSGTSKRVPPLQRSPRAPKARVLRKRTASPPAEEVPAA